MRLKVALLVALGTILILVSSALLLVRVRDSDQRVDEANRAIAAFGEIVALPALARDVRRGEEIADTDRSDLRIPSVYVPAGVLRDWPERSDPSQKYYAVRDMQAHQLISQGDVWLGSAEGGPLLAGGMGAVPIVPKNLDEVLPVLKLGDYVDIYWRRPAGGGQFEVRQIATGLRILGLPPRPGAVPAAAAVGAVPAAGVRASPSEAPKNAFDGRFVVEAAQERVAMLLQAAAQGDIYVAPAGTATHDDKGAVVVDNSVLRSLPLVSRAGAAPAPVVAAVERLTAAPQAPQLCNLSVVRASQRTTIQVPCN